MKPETILAKASEVSPHFLQYAENMLHEFPDMNMPTLKGCYKHHALPSEYRRHMDRVQKGTPT